MGWPREPSLSRVHIGKGAGWEGQRNSSFKGPDEEKLCVCVCVCVCEKLGREQLARAWWAGAVSEVVGDW